MLSADETYADYESSLRGMNTNSRIIFVSSKKILAKELSLTYKPTDIIINELETFPFVKSAYYPKFYVSRIGNTIRYQATNTSYSEQYTPTNKYKGMMQMIEFLDNGNIIYPRVEYRQGYSKDRIVPATTITPGLVWEEVYVLYNSSKFLIKRI